MRARTLAAAAAALSLMAVFAPGASAKFTQWPKGINATIDTMTRQPDGKLLVGFNWDKAVGGKPYDNLAVARFTANGKLDKSFGTGGYAFASPGTHNFEDVVRILVLPDKKILVGAQSSTEVQTGSVQVGLWRLLPNGKNDTSFGTRGDGTVINTGPDPLAGYELHDLLRLADGSYVASGFYEEDFTQHYGWLMPISADGAKTGYLQFQTSGSTYQDAQYMAPRADGTFFLAGETLGCPSGCVPKNRYASLDVFHADLTRDAGWASGGTATVDLGVGNELQLISYQHPLPFADGKVAMSFATTNAKVGVAVFGADGSNLAQSVIAPLKHQGQAALLERNGGMLLVGGGDRGGNPNATGAVYAAAFDRNAKLVRSYGTNGVARHSSSELGFWVEGAQAAVAVPGGKTVIAAHGMAMTSKFQQGMGLIRLKSNGALDRTFGG
jgi:uncharacterized delta-60 repeat protein